jgi:hypothetical protein
MSTGPACWATERRARHFADTDARCSVLPAWHAAPDSGMRGVVPGATDPMVRGSVVGVGRTPPPPWETGQRVAFRGRFGEDPDAYDRTRPVGPTAYSTTSCS